MSGELELTVLHAAREDLGYVASFAVTDRLILTAGGTTHHKPMVLASSNARHFEPRTTPRQLGLRDLLAVGDGVWTCGEHGQLALSRDQGATWKLFDTGTDACLFGLALATDGAVWVVGGGGYAARVLGERPERADFATSARLAAAYAMRDELVVLCGDGNIRRWRDGEVTAIATGAKRPLTAFTQTRLGTWLVVGDGGFISRSPDGAWFSRVASGVDVDLEAIEVIADGRVVAVGDHGIVLLSSDDGRTWKTFDAATTSHLWSVARFGGGVLIGGDDGLVMKLAPQGDATWHDRVDVFGRSRPHDAVFVAGPTGFVARGLAEYVGAPERTPRPGELSAFERDRGVPVPHEVARLTSLVRGRDCFAELALVDTLASESDGNLFERLASERGTGLVDAFCGVFRIGAQSNGDSYHVELYEWDGPRQVLHFDHVTRAFTGVIADSVDSLVFLAALIKAHQQHTITDEAFAIALRKLHGKVAPSWHFAIDDHDSAFVRLDPKRRDTEFFFYRSRWICALLHGDDLADVARMFMADFNQVVPDDQLPARYEACEKFMPTALYSMWRAFLFEEPELARYLEIGRRHRARLVRDAAALVDELRAGRDELGAIHSMRERLAEFRALDLDPRRAAQRQVEADARAKQQATRRADAVAELATTPRAGWADLAWRWLDDGIAHRALIEQLVREPELAEQLAAIDELRELSDGERELELPRLAERLAPELEAVLAGSLLRDDPLAGVLADAPARRDDDDAPGWDAIDSALERVYGGAEPHAHYGTAVPYVLGGNDPIHGVSVYLRDEPVPHFHFVTYGFTDLFAKETDDPAESGFGFELTLRVRRAPHERDVPRWALDFLQNLGRYVFGTGNRFAAGHKMGLNGPIALGRETAITAILFADDPELGDIASPFGRARFVQVVGITDDEYRLIQEWSTTGLVAILRETLPALVTDLGRGSVLDDAVVMHEVRARVEAEGSSEDLTFAGELAIEVDDGHVRIELGALYAAALPRAMRGRLRHDRAYTLRGRERALHLEPGPVARYELADEMVTLVVPPALVVEIEARLRPGLAGRYRFEAWPALEIVVTTSYIRDRDGHAIEVRGVGDRDEARRLVDAENARLATEPTSTGEAEDEDEDVTRPLDGDAVRAAVAMSERSLRLVPDDEDAQFTHAMLLVDGERAGVAEHGDALLAQLPRFAPAVRVNVAIRLAPIGGERFAAAAEIALSDPESASEVPEEQWLELVEQIVARPPDIGLLGLYDRIASLPVPDDDHARTTYLQAINNACVRAHAARAYELAARIADRAQPIAHENPYIYHSAACAYAAVGDYAKAFEQVKLAVEHEYDHLPKVETDRDLGPLLEWPEFKALFRDWHARQEGN